MTEKFRNKYRIASARLQIWDYSSNAAHFITLCSRNRKHFFGTIANAEMQLNAVGKIVETEMDKHTRYTSGHEFDIG